MSASTPEEPTAGWIPGYRKIDRLGSGGFATVYRARQEDYERVVAVKVLDISTDDERLRKRFRRETAAAGRLTGHPAVVTILDSGFTIDGHPYLTMPLYEAGSLRDRVRRFGPLPVADVLRIGVKIASALQAAHDAGIVHRDVKPENILMSAFGEPGLGDFGIASVTSSEATNNETSSYTPSHAAPELLMGRPASAASDIYGLGSTLYALLAGHPAFESTASTGLAGFITSALNDPVPPLERSDVPPRLEEALREAMAKDPEDRTPSATALARALQRVQQDLGLAVTELALPETMRRPDTDRAQPGSRALPSPSPDRSPTARPRKIDVTGTATDETILPPPAPEPPAQGAAANRFRIEGEVTVIGGRGERGELPPLASQAPSPKRKRRTALIVALVAAGVLVLGGGAAGVALLLDGRPATSPEPTDTAVPDDSTTVDDADVQWREYTLTGTVPAVATNADVGVRVNIECECSGPALLEIDGFSYSEAGESANRVPNPGFEGGQDPWGWEGSASAKLVTGPDGHGAALRIEATPGQWLYLNSGAFDVTPGTPFEFTVAARVWPQTDDAGYFDLIFLDVEETERKQIPLTPST